MQSMSDDELDKLFKEAAQGFTVSEDPAAWNAMSSKLDERDRHAVIWKRWRLAFIGMLGITVGSIWVYNSAQDEIENKKTVASLPSTAKVITEPTNTRKSATATTTESTALHIEINKEKKTSEKNQQSQSEKSSIGQNSLKQKNQRSTNPDSKVEKAQINLSQVAITMAPGSAPDPAQQEKSNIEESGNFDSTFQAEVMTTDSAFSDSTSKEQKQEQEQPRSRFSIKLALSPDFSSINFFTPYKPGINIGLLAGYDFNNRWSIFTGAVLSRKIYSSTEVDKSYSSGGYNYTIDQLDGDCRVLDIPVNVYYSFFANHSFSIKAGLGLSSYLMLQEDYTYYVKKYYTTDVYYQNIDHQNNEWFQVMNVSILFQKKVSDRFYLELEPFYKAPLAGIGEGKVSLVSLGTFLTVRFDLNTPNH